METSLQESTDEPRRSDRISRARRGAGGARRRSRGRSERGRRGRGGRGRRGRGAVIRKRKRTAEEDKAAEQEAARLEDGRLDEKYRRKLELKLIKVVQDLMAEGHNSFLKEAEVVEKGGWSVDYELDIDAVEANEEEFYTAFKKFLGSLYHAKLKDTEGNPLHILHGTMKGYITAVNGVWRDANRPIPAMLQLLCSKLMEAKRKDEQKLKAAGLVPDDYGREEMSFELYRELAWYFLRKGNLFAHMFLLLCWNMMVRNCNCDDMVFDNCLWRGDAFGVSVKRTKTNTDGKRDVQKDIKHIYANKFMPEICPILGMAMYFMAFPFTGVTAGRKHFFPGKDTHTRFNDDVIKALQDPELQRHLKNLGIPYLNVGAYSTRKGSTTYCTTGTTGGPSIVSVLLRAGWTIGKTLESYLRQAKAGDNFCGRVVCGLPVLHHNFAALPPQFKLLTSSEFKYLEHTINMTYPFHSLWGESFQPVVIFMMASLVHHQRWIQEKLPIEHVVRGKPNIWERLPELHRQLATGEEIRMTPSGVPPHAVLFGNIQRVEDRIERMQKSVDELPQQIYNKIKDFYHNRDTENGTASLSVVRDLIRSQTEDMKRIFTQQLTNLGRLPTPSSAPTVTTGGSTKPGGGIWFWSHGPDAKRKVDREIRGRYLPKTFRLSYDLKSQKRSTDEDCSQVTMTRKKVTAFDAWTWWWEGLQYGEHKIRPLKELQDDPKFHFFIVNACKRYHDLKQLISGMVGTLERNAGVPCVEEESADSKRMLFHQAWNLMQEWIKEHHPVESKRKKNLKETMSFTTLKKDFYDSSNHYDHKLKLKEFIGYLTQDDDTTYFLTSEEELDVLKVETEPKAFFKVFVSFLKDIGVPRKARDYKYYIDSVSRVWKNCKRPLPPLYENCIKQLVSQL